MAHNPLRYEYKSRCQYKNFVSKRSICQNLLKHWSYCLVSDRNVGINVLQATIAPPVKGKMFKGLCLCYAVVVTNYFSVAISGYWAFGNQTFPTIIGSFVEEQKLLVPKWFLVMTHIFILVQVLGVTVVSKNLFTC